MDNKNVMIIDHPLIQHKITRLRDKTTGTAEFRKLVNEIAMLMGYEALRDLRVWLEGERAADGGELCYESARCLQCGCCLEICPNFCAGEPFFGMAAFVPTARLIAELTPEQQTALRRSYRKHIYEGCGKSLACRDICPAGIELDRLLLHTNSAAVWKRR